MKIERAQKTRGPLLNVFGVYDHTNNNRMFTHCYKQKNGKQLLDFIRRVDSLYDSNVKRIFLVLDDNVSIHKSKKVIEFISRYHLRIKLVFSYRLNLLNSIL